jgi:hypothetical protein
MSFGGDMKSAENGVQAYYEGEIGLNSQLHTCKEDVLPL